MSGNNNNNSNQNKNKRRYQDNFRHKKHHRNPRRGGPGVLLTCETFREVKCRREGMAILQHYFHHGFDDKNNGDANIPEEEARTDGADSTKQGDDNASSASPSLSLEEELKALRSTKASSSSHFTQYETGSKGSVFLMCSAEGCQLIPPIVVDSDEGDNNDEKKKKKKIDDDSTESQGTSKKQRTGDYNKDDNTASAAAAAAKSTPANDATGKNDDNQEGSNSKPWDPVPVVCKVLADVESNVTSAPSSRFVTRMIPMQATCFASNVEIQATAEALLQKYFFPCPEYKTFAVSFQKRICNNVKRPEIIDMIAGSILDNEAYPKDRYTVSLDNPDATIVVEIVRTLCGISVVPRTKEIANNSKFSLVSARESKASPEE
ncbi:unnamed protein product [Cylindrotheca closterium]|uniref:THUMP domain-containing protein n=1 Tax=Cylindrotheca closterium TaxID=2856 RepID=A0AAD2CDV0_9STRA|nr:unnamed protein product [Cylindrotheca closterium]